MGNITWREALGGPWASHWIVWLGLYPPTTLLVLLRETITPYPQWWWPLLSATLQHLAVGLIIFGGAAIFRRRHTILPLITVGGIWGVAATARGFIGGGLAQAVAGTDPEFAFRITAWVISSALWVPVFVYTVAQFDQRRLLLGALDATHAGLDEARCRSVETAEQVQTRLRESVRQTLRPVLDDLQGSLANSRGSLSRARVDDLRARLTAVHDDVAAVVDSAGGGHREVAGQRPRASVRRAFDVEPERPMITALLVTFATIALIMPDAWRVFGVLAAAEVSVATTLAGLILVAVPHLALRAGRTVTLFPGQTVTVVSLVLSIAGMTWIMLTSGIDPITSNGLLISPLVAVALLSASTVFSFALALSKTNEEALHAVTAAAAELESLDSRHTSLLEHERSRLATLMHGPIQGRLAACVMALNFHSATEVSADDEEATAGLIASVMRHLHDVSADLLELAGLDAPVAQPTPEQGHVSRPADTPQGSSRT